MRSRRQHLLLPGSSMGGGVTGFAPPSAPTNLASTLDSTQAVLTWTASAGATSYNLYRSTVSGSEVQVQTGLIGTSYTNTGLTNETVYYYQLTAVGPGGESARSGEISVTPTTLLLTNIAWWRLDETSTGTRTDSGPNALNLTASNAPNWISGQVYVAATFVAASTQTLSHVDTTTLRLAGKDWTIALWFNLQLSTNGGVYNLLTKATNADAPVLAEYAFTLYQSSGVVKLHGLIGYSGNGYVEVIGTPAITLDEWHLAVLWHDTTAHTLNLQIDNGTPDSVAANVTLNAAVNSLVLGADAGNNRYFTGYLDEVAIWSSATGGGGVLSSTLRTKLWNSGHGITYPGTILSAGRSYYISSAGNDSDAGTSAAAPWKTFGPANALKLIQGDTIYLNGGDTFTGPLTLTGTSNNHDPDPITVTSYGTGQATISVPDSSDEILLDTISGVTVQNLAITGSGVTSGGITTLSPNFAGVRCRNLSTHSHRYAIMVSGCTINGCYSGVALLGYDQATSTNGYPYKNCIISNNTITKCVFAGVHLQSNLSGAESPRSNNITMSSNHTYDNHGSASYPNSGYGFALIRADNSLVSQNLIHNCGAGGGGQNGGIVVYHCDGVTVSENTVYSILDATHVDGDGIDIDSQCNNCIVEYNYTQDCDGVGYLFFTSSSSSTGCVFRYNIDQNSGRSRTRGVSGFDFDNASISNVDCLAYNNTFFLDSHATSASSVIRATANADTAKITNNLLVIRHYTTFLGVPQQLMVNATGTPVVVQNLYDSDGDAAFTYGNAGPFTGLAALHAAGGEVYNSVNYGVVAASLLSDAGGGNNQYPPAMLTAYDPTGSSPAIDAGVNLQTLFSINPGILDFHGNPNSIGIGYDIGAVEDQGS